MKPKIHVSKMTTVLILTLLVSIPAFGQGFVKKYQSPPGFTETRGGTELGFGDRMDMDGDGRPELVLERFNEQEIRIEFVVINQVDQAVMWQLNEGDLAALGIQDDIGGFLGFLGYVESGVRVAVFGGRAAGFLKMIDPSTNQELFVFPQRANKLGSTDELRFAIFDVDGDDYPDLIVSDAETQTVQVWGAETTSTATEEDIEAALLHLFQSYPNPFRASTTITYEVEQPGPVTITVYDALGRSVKTLVDGQQAAGRHAVVWDGHDTGGQAVASGTYFYRLRVGEAVTSKQTIRVK